MQPKLSQRDDSGLVTIFMVLMLPTLLLLGALVFDGARQRPVKRDAQGRADAAAVAAALGCAKGTCAPTTAAASYVGGGIAVQSATCTSPTCTVTMGAPFPYQFATGSRPGGVTASATATWGALGKGIGTFPLSVAGCAFNGLVINGPPVTLHSYDTPGCTTGQGQFGWIANGCNGLTVTVGGPALPGTPGNNPGGTGCGAGPTYTGPGGDKNLCGPTTPAPQKCYLGTDVLVPVWGPPPFTGSYPIIKFALFHLTGWSDNGGNFGGSLNKQCDASADGGVDEHINKPCIRGFFKGFVTEIGTIVPGLTCDTFTACEVKLSQ